MVFTAHKIGVADVVGTSDQTTNINLCSFTKDYAIGINQIYLPIRVDLPLNLAGILSNDSIK
jgi:hypothetical protein